MDQKKTGALIRVLRLEKGLTQQGLAELLGVSNRAVSKWERGLGSPDLSLLPALSLQLGVDLAGLLSGGLPEPDNTGGSMKHIRFFVCPQCGDLITATGEAAVSCCGRRLEPLPVQKPDEAHSLQIHPVEDEWFITSGHPMEKCTCFFTSASISSFINSRSASHIPFTSSNFCLLARTINSMTERYSAFACF